MSGTTDKIKGRVKEAIGVATGNKRLKHEGRTDQAVGKVKKGRRSRARQGENIKEETHKESIIWSRQESRSNIQYRQTAQWSRLL